MICNYRDLEKVCRSLGLKLREGRNARIWTGTVNGEFVRISIHKHAEGRDVPTGTLRSYIKDLGFATPEDFYNYLNEI